MELTPENYKKGFLVDDDLLAGITNGTQAQSSGLTSYRAFIVNHTTGEHLGVQDFETLDEALVAINSVQRSWRFESTSACGGGKCGTGKCDPTQCGAVAKEACGNC